MKARSAADTGVITSDGEGPVGAVVATVPTVVEGQGASTVVEVVDTDGEDEHPTSAAVARASTAHRACRLDTVQSVIFARR